MFGVNVVESADGAQVGRDWYRHSLWGLGVQVVQTPKHREIPSRGIPVVGCRFSVASCTATPQHTRTSKQLTLFVSARHSFVFWTACALSRVVNHRILKTRRSGCCGQHLPQKLGRLNGPPACPRVLLPYPELQRALALFCCKCYDNDRYHNHRNRPLDHRIRRQWPELRFHARHLVNRAQDFSLGNARPRLRSRQDRCNVSIRTISFPSDPRPQPPHPTSGGTGESRGSSDDRRARRQRHEERES